LLDRVASIRRRLSPDTDERLAGWYRLARGSARAREEEEVVVVEEDLFVFNDAIE
jgi:hypothetical protein